MSCAVTFSACSKEKSPEKEAGALRPSARQQAAEAIEEYGKKHIDKAKNTRSLAEDRTKGIDEAVKNMDRR